MFNNMKHEWKYIFAFKICDKLEFFTQFSPFHRCTTHDISNMFVAWVKNMPCNYENYKSFHQLPYALSPSKPTHNTLQML